MRFARKIAAFVRARRKPGGGFGATPGLPATVRDTYHALRILHALAPFLDEDFRALSGGERLRRHLEEIGDMDTWTERTAFEYLWSCRVAGAGTPPGWPERFVRKRLRSARGLLTRYYCRRIIRECLRAPGGVVSPSVRDPDVKWRTAYELWMALYLSGGDPSALSTTREALVRWLRACQNPDGGFGFFPGTTSYMKNGHTCLRALALMGSAPRDTEAARGFILSALTSDGGIARKHGGAPFLDATWDGTAALRLLSEMDAPKGGAPCA